MDGGLQAPTLPFFASSSNVNTCIVNSSSLDWTLATLCTGMIHVKDFVPAMSCSINSRTSRQQIPLLYPERGKHCVQNCKGLRYQLGAGSPTSFWVSWRESQCRNRLSNFNFEHGNLLGVL